MLGPDESGWEQSDGVYSWPILRERAEYKYNPPEGARIVFFQGNQKPWHFVLLGRPNRRGDVNEYQWIPRNYH